MLANSLHRYDEAEAAYRRAIDLDPKAFNPWQGLGSLLANSLHRYDEAEAAYRRAIDLDPKAFAPWNGLGILLATSLHRYDEAEAAYRRAIDLDPKAFAPWNSLGNLLRSLRRCAEALECYGHAVQLKKDTGIPAKIVPVYSGTSGASMPLEVMLLPRLRFLLMPIRPQVNGLS